MIAKIFSFENFLIEAIENDRRVEFFLADGSVVEGTIRLLNTNPPWACIQVYRGENEPPKYVMASQITSFNWFYTDEDHKYRKAQQEKDKSTTL